MTYEEYLDKAAELLVAARPAKGGRYILYASNSELGLCRFQDRPPGYRYIGNLSSADINEGPTPKRWQYIAGVIYGLHKKGLL